MGSGLPVGPEGPIVHMGGIVGARLSQGMSTDEEDRDSGCAVKAYRQFTARFRNSRDRRDYITGGVAAGVAAAFSAPVGGLLFAMEEVASYWSNRLSWKIFFGCAASVYTADLLNSCLEGYSPTGTFGSLSTEASVLFSVGIQVAPHVYTFIPAVFLGVLGGAFGSLFTAFNLRLSRMRKEKIAPHKWFRLLDPVVIVAVYFTITLFLPSIIPCKTAKGCMLAKGQGKNDSLSLEYECDFGYNLRSKTTFNRYTCPMPELAEDGTITVHYNDLASLMFGPGEGAVHTLMARATGHHLGYPALLLMLVVYFIGACCSSGSAIAAGLVVPMLLIGACLGRLVGKVCMEVYGGPPQSEVYSWIDPGVFALIGAGAFFGGVSRLTISLTVIMCEISNDINMLLPMMVAVLVAKWIADYTTHSLYHALLELKCMPFLDDQIPSKTDLNRHSVQKVMNSPMVTIGVNPTVAEVTELLDGGVTHNGFAVVEPSAVGGEPVLVGLILRDTLDELLHEPRVHSPAGGPSSGCVQMAPNTLMPS